MGHLPCSLWLLLQPSGPTNPQQLRHFLLPLFREDLSVLAPLRLQLMLVGEQPAPPPGLAALCEATVRFFCLKKGTARQSLRVEAGNTSGINPAQAVSPPALGLCSGGSGMSQDPQDSTTSLVELACPSYPAVTRFFYV